MRTAETAEEGLQALNRQSFDVIISDFRLPGIDGLEFLRMAKRCQTGAISMLITAYRDQGIASKAAEIGIHDFIEKPFAIGALVESLARLIKKQR